MLSGRRPSDSTTTSAAFLKSASLSSLATVFASSVFMFEATENKTKPPFFLDTMKYCEMRAPSESSQEENPLNTTSLSTSSLVRPEANFPLQSFASPATTAEATSRPLIPSFGGTILTKPTASSDLHAAPVDATAIGVSALLRTFGLCSVVLRMKFDAS